jgi:hypothetical protein
MKTGRGPAGKPQVESPRKRIWNTGKQEEDPGMDLVSRVPEFQILALNRFSEVPLGLLAAGLGFASGDPAAFMRLR